MRSLLRVVSLPLVVGLVLFVPTVERAWALLLRLNLDSLVEKSKFIVTGEVVGVESYRAPFLDLGEVIFTDVKIRIEKRIKGQPDGEEITVQVLGGEIGTQFQSCPDSPRYEKGEKVLVFLREWSGKLWNVGWLQGKYKLIQEGSVVQGKKDLPVSVDTPLSSLEADILRRVSESPPASSKPPLALTPASPLGTGTASGGAR